MVTKISLVKISAGASLLECKCAAQDFIIATDTVFYKAQGLAMLAPLHEMAPSHSKDKGKAKAMEEDNDKEDEATQKLREELENFVVLRFTAAADRIL
ncbi:hypothetical protein C0995_015210 [Termitomyces sp. Mi166|nr:hypothetical protein C0995_015210 [Termitomyces sp. Mi166\